MGTVANIKSGIEARIASSLPNYTKLSYQIDIDRNKFKGNKLQYSVIPNIASEVDGLIGAFTLDQSFNFTFTNSYNAGAKSQINDSLKVDRIQELMDNILTAYSDIQLNKSNIDSTVLIINNLQINEPEYNDEEKFININWSINIKYKTNI